MGYLAHPIVSSSHKDPILSPSHVGHSPPFEVKDEGPLRAASQVSYSPSEQSGSGASDPSFQELDAVLNDIADPLRESVIAVAAYCTNQALYVYLRCCESIGKDARKIVCGAHRDHDNKEMKTHCPNGLDFVALDHCFTTDGKPKPDAGAIPTCQIVPTCRMQALDAHTVTKLTQAQHDELAKFG